MKITMILEKDRAQSRNVFSAGLVRETGDEQISVWQLLGRLVLRRLLLLWVGRLAVLLHRHSVEVGHHLLLGLAALSGVVVAVHSVTNRACHSDSPFGVLFSATPL